MGNKLRSLDLGIIVIVLSIISLFGSGRKGEASNSNIVIWAATGGGVSKTEDGGKTWINYFLGENKYAHSIAVRDSVIWVGTESGVCKSLDGGKTWTAYDADDGLPAYHLDIFKNKIFVSALSIQSDGNVWIGCSYLPQQARTVAKTQNGGRSWKLYELNKGKIGYDISAIISTDGSIWVGAKGTQAYSPKANPIYRFGGLYRTDDNGKTWRVFTTENGLSGNSVSSVFNHGNHIYVITEKGIDLTENSGKSWKRFAPNKFKDFDITMYPRSIFVVNDQEISVAYGTILSVTRDAGKTWNDIDISGTVKEPDKIEVINSILIIDGAIWLGVTLRDPNDNPLGGVLKSVDGGKTWSVYTVHEGVGGYVYALTFQK